jgi:hypothetical protein
MPGRHLLPGVLVAVDEPCLFWLDAHAMASGVRGQDVTPIDRELRFKPLFEENGRLAVEAR